MTFANVLYLPTPAGRFLPRACLVPDEAAVDVNALKHQQWQFAKCCLDWTERQYHIADSLGAALLNYLLENRLILKAKHEPRIIFLTTAGRIWLAENLNLSLI